jgi:negative regulator of flagellin synthesis FlgM
MQIYGPSSVHGPQSVGSPHGVRTDNTVRPASAGAISDQLDISPAAQHLDQISQLPDIRQSRVNDIRTAIANGTYETANKLDVAVSRLLDEIG